MNEIHSVRKESFCLSLILDRLAFLHDLQFFLLGLDDIEKRISIKE